MIFFQINLKSARIRFWRILLLLFVAYSEAKECRAQVQPPPAPQNVMGITRTKVFPVGNIGPDGVKRGWLLGPISFDVEYDSVHGATSYLLDVAEDSLFTQFLPGLRNYSARYPFHDCTFPRNKERFPTDYYGTYECIPSSRGKGNIRVAGLLQGGKKYFVRMKAINSAGESPFSSSASISVVFSPFSQGGYSAYPFYIFNLQMDRYLSARLKHLTDTSVTFNFYARDNVRFQATVNGQDAITSTHGNTVTVTGLRSGTTNTINLKAVTAKFFGDSLVFQLRPFSRDMLPFASIIEYYQGPEYPGRGADSLYTRVEMFPNFSISAVEDTLRSLRAQQVPIDTAWYNTGGFITCINQGRNSCSEIEEAYPSLLIKLKRKDPRIISYSYPIDAWRYSDEAIFYRFSFGGTVGVQEPSISSLRMVELHQNRPNPFSEETTLEITLPEYSRIQVDVFDVLGRSVAEAQAITLGAGRHTIPVRLPSAPNGVYQARVSVKGESGRLMVKTVQMMIVK